MVMLDVFEQAAVISTTDLGERLLPPMLGRIGVGVLVQAAFDLTLGTQLLGERPDGPLAVLRTGG